MIGKFYKLKCEAIVMNIISTQSVASFIFVKRKCRLSSFISFENLMEYKYAYKLHIVLGIFISMLIFIR